MVGQTNWAESPPGRCQPAGEKPKTSKLARAYARAAQVRSARSLHVSLARPLQRSRALITSHSSLRDVPLPATRL